MSQPPNDGRNAAGILVVILVFFVLISVISYVWFPTLAWTEQRDAGEEIVEDTYSADNAIKEYEWFRTQYHDIQTQRSQVDNSYDERERFYEVHGDDPQQWDRHAAERHNRIEERITGNQNQLEMLAGEYNARSDMAHREVFKCNLPYQVDDRFAIVGPPGSGDADEPQDVDLDGNPIEGSPPPAEECNGLPTSIET